MNKIVMFFGVCLLGLFFCAGCCHSMNKKLDFYKSANVFKSVVRLRSEVLGGNGSYSASGFAIDKKHIITAGHFCSSVVEGPLMSILSEDIDIYHLNNNDEVATSGAGKIIAVDEDYDLCIIRKEKHGIIPLKLLNNYKSVKVGDDVVVLGAPLTIFPVRTMGEVISAREPVSRRPRLSRLVLFASVAPGNSGGPVINEQGRVIGVLVEVNSMYHHISMAVPVDILKRFLKENEQQMER